MTILMNIAVRCARFRRCLEGGGDRREEYRQYEPKSPTKQARCRGRRLKMSTARLGDGFKPRDRRGIAGQRGWADADGMAPFAFLPTGSRDASLGGGLAPSAFGGVPTEAFRRRSRPPTAEAAFP